MPDRQRPRHARLMCGAALVALALATSAHAQSSEGISIAPQALDTALNELGSQSNQQLMIRADIAAGKMTRGVTNAPNFEAALVAMLDGTGLVYRREGSTYLVVSASDPQSGSAAGDGADQGTVQALIVTAQKREEDIQDVPIAISAFTQEDLTRSQVAGGPDLMTQVPNFTFTKTNFSGYSIQIRGIGTQAISATVDPAVAVAFNNTPFIRNRFFEQEFYDLQRVEVLRGPQGTLYGRNATAGVVNIISAKPSFQYQAKLSGDVSNYNSTRFEGMINLPLVDDMVALRLAGAWTKRDGYDTNEITGNRIDGRDLWSTRLSLRFTPTDKLEANLIWEHFQENDDRLRSGKQLCHTDDRTEIQGHPVPAINGYSAMFSQGCLAASLYGPESFQVPNGFSLPYYRPLAGLSLPIPEGGLGEFNPYANTVQSHDLRVIESTVDPEYRAKSDLAEIQINVDLTNDLTLTSETGYNADTVFSLEDYNRFNTEPGAFANGTSSIGEPLSREGVLTPGPDGGIFCDPQIGCADRLVAMDVSTAKSRQFSQEFRLSSDYDGPFNFSLGANFLRHDTEDKYYVFINTLSLYAALPFGFGINVLPGRPLPAYVPGVTDNRECLGRPGPSYTQPAGMLPPDPSIVQNVQYCVYMDPNPIGSLNDEGHNYFLSRNPYKLISYAAFGELYYDVTDNLKITAGLRWTVDRKEAPRIPSWVLAADSVGYPVTGVERQEWREPTGRLTIDWKPDLGFTDETLLYASYAHGYKAGGANPPPAGVVAYFPTQGDQLSTELLEQSATHPTTFKPEFVNAFEVGSKNTLLEGRLTINAAAFYYDYTGYQISQIVDRSAINYNFDARVWGLELESDWRPLENFRLGLKLGYEDTRVADGAKAVDVMDRTAGVPGWVVVRPFPTFTSNCVLPAYAVAPDGNTLNNSQNTFINGNMGYCEFAYLLNHDPLTNQPYVPNPSSNWAYNVYPGYPGFDPTTAPNHGEGFFKDLSGNALPNAPHITATITADYTLPLPADWLMTLHTDLYYQSEAWTRIFNTPGYDKLKAYTNVNFAAIFTNEEAGWKIMAYVKNVMDRDSITGAFLNSDDTGLTTNVFLTEPRLYGLRVTKEWNGGPWWTGANPNHPAGEPYPFTVELGGQVQRWDAPYDPIVPGFAGDFSPALSPTAAQNRDLDHGDGRELRLVYRPAGAAWQVSAGARIGRTNGTDKFTASEAGDSGCVFYGAYCDPDFNNGSFLKYTTNWSKATVVNREEHTIVDFGVGHDLGLGSGLNSTVSAGLRYADIESRTRLTMVGIPSWEIPDEFGLFAYAHHILDQADLTSNREFKGLGPTLTWEAGKRLFGDEAMGHVDLDWSLTGGVLFGKQKRTVDGDQTSTAYDTKYRGAALSTTTDIAALGAAPSKSVTVPVADLSLGLSYEIQRVKLGAGYRWERYFNALDAGFEEHKSYDRTIDGPYFKIAVGFGG